MQTQENTPKFINLEKKPQILSYQKSLHVTWKRIKGINFWAYIKSSQWVVK